MRAITRGEKQTFTLEKKTTRAGWPRRLALVRATPRADDEVVGAQVWSFARTSLLWLALSRSLRSESLPLIIVDNSHNMHSTAFFPDRQLLSATSGSIWIPHLARCSEIFKEPNFQVVKRKSTCSLHKAIHLRNTHVFDWCYSYYSIRNSQQLCWKLICSSKCLVRALFCKNDCDCRVICAEKSWVLAQRPI